MTVDGACRPPGRGPGGVSGSVLTRRKDEVPVTGLVFVAWWGTFPTDVVVVVVAWPEVRVTAP